MWDPALVHWPEEQARRLTLAALHIPRLLMVAQGASPPVDLSEDEDWISLPAATEDVVARRQMLGRRFADRLHLDNGLLRSASATAVLSRREEAVLRVLLERRDRIVSRDELMAAMTSRPSARAQLGMDRCLYDVVHRLRRRLEPFGVDVRHCPPTGYRLDLRYDETDIEQV